MGGIVVHYEYYDCVAIQSPIYAIGISRLLSAWCTSYSKIVDLYLFSWLYSLKVFCGAAGGQGAASRSSFAKRGGDGQADSGVCSDKASCRVSLRVRT